MSSDAVPASGALLVGLVFAVWLSSSVVHFASSYLRRTVDPWQWRVAVVFLAALSTAHTGILCHAMYEHLIERFGDEANLPSTGWELTAHLAILLTLATVAHAYYAAKLSTLYNGRRRAGLVGVVALLTCVQLAFGIAATYSSFRSSVSLFTVDLGSKFGWQLLASSLAGLLANVVIALAMVADMRSGRFAAKDETVVEVLTRLLFETNLTTAIVSILSFAFYLAWNAEGQQSGGLSMVLPKLYLLSVLASLERGADVVQGGLSRNMKHASTLSDFFKGVPLAQMRGTATPSPIGTPIVHPTPIADRFAGATPDQPGWLRRTFQPATPPLEGSTPLQSLAPPPAGFAHPSFAPRESLAAPQAERPLTSISVSDYGAWLDDAPERNSAALHGGQRGEEHPDGGIEHYAGAQGGAPQRDVFASGVEHAAQTPTPRKATFGGAISGSGELAGGGTLEGRVHAAAPPPGGAERAAQGGPVRYGYL
ncbi:hypothetical protein DMC30DRAFT_426549 [Rhodotorula diobovata]|uniref:DUF6534 domain-containing protein n=1 Tax=Rhodotorula diobovata TaxID=5288 RepID=A0A5C5FRR6_9BASI|nr:hypothetical protein DMC30DRAFT_426549 [Rhodotorula diobovata]